MRKIILFILCVVYVQLNFGQTASVLYDIGAQIKSQVPTIATDGTIYIGSEDNTNFHAINPDGSLKWKYNQLTDNVYSSASIGRDGTIYVGSKDDNLHAINPIDGSRKWVFPLGGDAIYSSPAIANDGTIYISSDSDNFFAVNPDGTQKWVFTTAGFNIRSTPAIASDGTVYIASDDDKLYALNPDNGSIKANWPYDIGGDVEGGIALDSDGTIILGVDAGTPDGYVYAINPDATLKWQSANVGRVLSSPVIANGNVYFGTKDTNSLYALNTSTGVAAWAAPYKAGDIILSSPVVGDDGKIYFGSFDDKLYCLNSDGTLNFDLELSTGNNVWSSPVITTDGNLIIGSYDGKLYKVTIPSTGLASSNWPMFGKNLQHTSSADKTLGVDDFNSIFEQSLQVFYKNGELNLKVDGFSGNSSIKLFDLLGRDILSKTIKLQENKFNKMSLKNINSGIYILKLKGENNTVIASRKFVISN